MHHLELADLDFRLLRPLNISSGGAARYGHADGQSGGRVAVVILLLCFRSPIAGRL